LIGKVYNRATGSLSRTSLSTGTNEKSRGIGTEKGAKKKKKNKKGREKERKDGEERESERRKTRSAEKRFVVQ